jgi:hypothetical protein
MNSLFLEVIIWLLLTVILIDMIHRHRKYNDQRSNAPESPSSDLNEYKKHYDSVGCYNCSWKHIRTCDECRFKKIID